jgi:hypothetical protein
MPVCNKCKKFSNCLTVDFCEHCGAKDWQQKTVLKPTTFKSKSEDLGCYFSVIGGLLSLVLFLGGLWLAVAVVKWMWQHS